MNETLLERIQAAPDLRRERCLHILWQPLKNHDDTTVVIRPDQVANFLDGLLQPDQAWFLLLNAKIEVIPNSAEQADSRYSKFPEVGLVIPAEFAGNDIVQRVVRSCIDKRSELPHEFSELRESAAGFHLTTSTSNPGLDSGLYCWIETSGQGQKGKAQEAPKNSALLLEQLRNYKGDEGKSRHE